MHNLFALPFKVESLRCSRSPPTVLPKQILHSLIRWLFTYDLCTASNLGFPRRFNQPPRGSLLTVNCVLSMYAVMNWVKFSLFAKGCEFEYFTFFDLCLIVFEKVCGFVRWRNWISNLNHLQALQAPIYFIKYYENKSWKLMSGTIFFITFKYPQSAY